MSRPAIEIYDVVKQNRSKRSKMSYTTLKDKCVESVTEMMKHGELDTEVELSDSDMESLVSVTKEMRDLGYYYCLIETQDSKGEIQGHRLRISIAHLDGEKND